MVQVTFTANLQRHVECPTADVPGATVAEVLSNYFGTHPQARRYILDDQGALHRHVIVFLGEQPVGDRSRLTDPVSDGQRVFVFQALSGG
jgi:sulfur carrier protein ThiS